MSLSQFCSGVLSVFYALTIIPIFLTFPVLCTLLKSRQIWLRFLPTERILPFGCKDNFWYVPHPYPFLYSPFPIPLPPHIPSSYPIPLAISFLPSLFSYSPSLFLPSPLPYSPSLFLYHHLSFIIFRHPPPPPPIPDHVTVYRISLHSLYIYLQSSLIHPYFFLP